MEEIKEQAYREPADYEDSKVKFPGAIKKNTHVLAVMRDNKTWCLAKIMEVRNKMVDEDINWGLSIEQSPAQSEENNPESGGHHRKPARREYEYYVTYLEHERRNDRWVPEVCLRIDDEKVNLEINKLDDRKRKEEDEATRFRFLANDVHLGMQPHQI